MHQIFAKEQRRREKALDKKKCIGVFLGVKILGGDGKHRTFLTFGKICFS